MTLWIAGPSTQSFFIAAWELSRRLWVETITAFAQHFAVVLLYAAPPATYRAWAILRTKAIPGWWSPVVEVLIAVWRLFMIALAVWIVLTPTELTALEALLTNGAPGQDIFYSLGQAVQNQSELLAWELAFFLAGILLVWWVFSLMARLWIQGMDMDMERKKVQRRALTAAAVNLLLVPAAMIYAVVLTRHLLI